MNNNNNSINRNFIMGSPMIKLNPWWVTGIVDAEGNFSVVTIKTKVVCAFKVTQRDHSVGILYDLFRYFNCGSISIDNREENSFKFAVYSLEDLCTILDHFDKYPLVGSKSLDYNDFKTVVKMRLNLSSITPKDLDKIIYIKLNMNKGRSFEERWNYLNGLTNVKLNPEWVQAFIDGEGSFQFGISNTVNKNKRYLSVYARLEIAQNSHDIRLLQFIRDFFGHGFLQPKYDISSLSDAKASRSVSRFVLSNNYVIIKFIDKYPMLTRKQLDYEDWKRLIELKNTKQHHTKDGLSKMISIRKGMNKFRTTVTISSDLEEQEDYIEANILGGFFKNIKEWLYKLLVAICFITLFLAYYLAKFAYIESNDYL